MKATAQSEVSKIVYLFGAGATHAELANLDPDLIPEKRGLLIGDVSKRVIERARRDKKYLKDVAMVSGTSGSLNIELLISLIESSKINGWGHNHRQGEIFGIVILLARQWIKISGPKDHWQTLRPTEYARN